MERNEDGVVKLCLMGRCLVDECRCFKDEKPNTEDKEAETE